MKSINVKGTARTETGKKATRELRKNGNVPCNLYGESKGENGENTAMSFYTSQEELTSCCMWTSTRSPRRSPS